jgi:hypothetical protein
MKVSTLTNPTNGGSSARIHGDAGDRLRAGACGAHCVVRAHPRQIISAFPWRSRIPRFASWMRVGDASRIEDRRRYAVA